MKYLSNSTSQMNLPNLQTRLGQTQLLESKQDVHLQEKSHGSNNGQLKYQRVKKFHLLAYMGCYC